MKKYKVEFILLDTGATGVKGDKYFLSDIELKKEIERIQDIAFSTKTKGVIIKFSKISLVSGRF